MSGKSLQSIAIVLFAVGTVFVVLVTVALPADNLTYSALQNFGHFGLFAVLGGLCLWQLTSTLPFLTALLLSTFLLTGIGLAVEWVQSGLSGRTASASDFVLDILGIVVGYLLFFAHRFFVTGRTAGSTLLVGAALLTTVFVSRPLFSLVGFDVFRPGLPVIRSFKRPLAANKIESVGKAHFEIASIDGKTALAVRFRPGDYSGVIFQESASLWSDYSGIRVKIYNSMQQNRQIALRINDQLHNNLYSDRYNSQLLVAPGLNEFTVLVEDVVNMGNNPAAQRQMDIDNVSRIQFFASDVSREFTLHLLDVELF